MMQHLGGRPESACRDAAVGPKDEEEEEEAEEERTAADALVSELQPSPQEGEPTRRFPSARSLVSSLDGSQLPRGVTIGVLRHSLGSRAQLPQSKLLKQSSDSSRVPN